MTTDDLIALSRRVAEKLGIAPYTDRYPNDDWSTDMFWLHEDSARCFALMCENDLRISWWNDRVFAEDSNLHSKPIMEAFYYHNNDRNLAARVAILKALEAM